MLSRAVQGGGCAAVVEPTEEEGELSGGYCWKCVNFAVGGGFDGNVAYWLSGGSRSRNIWWWGSEGTALGLLNKSSTLRLTCLSDASIQQLVGVLDGNRGRCRAGSLGLAGVETWL